MLFFTQSQAQRTKARELADSANAAWEEWTLDGPEISKTETSPSRLDDPLPTKYRTALGYDSVILKAPAQEYSVLFAATMSRVLSFLPVCEADLARFNRLLRTELLDLEQNHVAETQSVIIRANAALSHFSSQTFAGTSPVFETECHYWPHSLLGVGMASLALFNLRAFIEQIFSRSRLLDRIDQLVEEDPVERELSSLPSSHDFWTRDQLFDYPAQENLSNTDESPTRDVLPLVTCFSGRDSFRSTEVSLSAPLDSISACNTAEFTLGTLTHEISHRYIEGFLGIFLPSPSDNSELEYTLDILESGNYKNLHEQLQGFLCHAAWRVSSISSQEITVNELRLLILDNWRRINEVLTHCFDFMYFYGRDPKRYIRSIWATWGVLPSSLDRVREYILRSLCALLTRNIGRKKSLEITIDQLKRELTSTLAAFPHTLYVPEALRLLDQPERVRDFQAQLGAHRDLVAIARYFLYSENIERLFQNEPLLSTGTHDGYRLKNLSFPDELVRNPLAFIDSYSTDTQADARRSAWLLHQLAFMDSTPWRL